jgi:hypothetical protein
VTPNLRLVISPEPVSGPFRGLLYALALSVVMWAGVAIGAWLVLRGGS